MAEMASPRFQAVYDAAEELAFLIVDIQAPTSLLPKDGESGPDFADRIMGNHAVAQLNDGPVGDEAREFIEALNEYVNGSLKPALKKLDAAAKALHDAIFNGDVCDQLRKVNPAVVRLGILPAHSHAEALLELAWHYRSQIRTLDWTDRLTPPGISLADIASHSQFGRNLPRLLFFMADTPPIFSMEVMPCVEKEVLLATDAAEVPAVDPWSVDMLSLFVARGGHLTDTEREIYAIVKARGTLMSAAEIEDALADKYGDAKTGSASNSLAFLTRCTLLSKGPGGRGYQVASGGKA